MKRVLLGSLLSCMLVGQAFGSSSSSTDGSENNQPQANSRSLMNGWNVAGAVVGAVAMGVAYNHYSDYDFAGELNNRIKRHNAAVDKLTSVNLLNEVDKLMVSDDLMTSPPSYAPVLSKYHECSPKYFAPTYNSQQRRLHLGRFAALISSPAYFAMKSEEINQRTARPTWQPPVDAEVAKWGENLSSFCKGLPLGVLAVGAALAVRHGVNAGYNACKSLFGY